MIKDITFPNYTPGILARQWASLYQQVSTNPLPDRVTGLHSCFKPYLNTLYAAQGRQKDLNFQYLDRPFLPARLRDNGTVLVGFSGGKDSAAAALALQAQGLAPVLFYVNGINYRSYAGERVYAARVAQVLNMPFVEVTVKQTGEVEYPDNPVKNQFILSLMVDYAYRHGGSNFAQGNLAKETIREANINFTYSDAGEMYAGAEPVFRLWTVESYKYLGGVMRYESESFKTLHELCPAALDTVLSCLQPYRFRTKVRQANEKKYGVKLRPEMCGTCYKCASEYLHRCILGIAVAQPEYVKQCVSILRKEYQRLANLDKLPSAKDAITWFIEPSICDHAIIGI